MKYIQGHDRNQTTLLPDSVEDLISKDNPVRFIDVFVDKMDIEGMGFKKSTPAETGRPSYDPRDLLKLYIYGYFNKIRSSRKLMTECTRNIELFFLLNRLTPDFRTIADYRKDNSDAIHKVFRAFAKLCLKLKLYEKELFAIDGSKFRAVNSKANSYNRETLIDKLKRIDEHIANYLSQMNQEDSSSFEAPAPSKEAILAAMDELNSRKEKYIDFINYLDESGETQILTTDPEARVMHSKDGFHCYYNVQTAVDKGSHLIADYMVTNNCTDQGLLKDVSEGVKELMEEETVEVVADKGYESRDDIKDCIMNGIVPNVAFKYDKSERIYSIDYVENEITEDIRNSTEPENIQKCISAGVLPACYENTAIEVEVQEQNDLSCFILNDHGTVTCPMGNKLSKVKSKGKNTIYACKEACRQCSNRCTASKNHKTVSFGPTTKFVPVKMFGNINSNLTKIPGNIPMNPFNHTLERNDQPKKKVVLKIKEDTHKLKERMQLSEHPFGTVKWYHGAHYLLCKGIKKTTAELGLSFLVYNMKRAINMVGIEKLIAEM